MITTVITNIELAQNCTDKHWMGYSINQIFKLNEGNRNNTLTVMLVQSAQCFVVL